MERPPGAIESADVHELSTGVVARGFAGFGALFG